MLVNSNRRKENELNSIWSRKNLTLDWSVLYLLYVIQSYVRHVYAPYGYLFCVGAKQMLQR